MAIELARVITDNGGTILINAPVSEILTSKVGDSYVASGVIMADAEKTIINASKVVSGAGFVTTFNKLLKPNVCQELSLPRTLKVPQSAGFVMANIGKIFSFLKI